MSTVVKGIIGVAEVAIGTVTGQVWLVGMGVATLLAVAASLIDPAKQGPGLQEFIAYDPTFPRQLIVGRTITAGSLVAQFTHDHLPLGGGNEGKNRVLEQVIALADHECDGLEQIFIDGQVANVGTYDSVLGYPITTTVDPVTHETSVDYTNYLWVQFFTGADSQTVDAHLNSVLGSDVWPSTSVGQNICYARVTAVYNTTLLSSPPQLQFVMRGAKMYDPRLDSTVGGSGAQRWGTNSTYAWSNNLAVIAYNICRGIFVGGALFYGASASADEVPFAQAVSAMNACDEAVPLKAGGTEPRYSGGGQTPVNQDAQSFLANIATAMAGYIGTGGGSIVILPGVAQTPVFSFSDDDIMAKEQYDNAPKFGFDTLKNAVFATFIDPTQNWTRNSAPTRTSSADITADGGIELGDNYSLDMISSGTQAQRVMEIIRQRSRRMITQTVTLGPNAASAERGDWVQWNSAQWGYSEQPFFIAGVQLKPNLDTVLSLVQVDSDIYDWDPSTDELTPAGGLLPSAAPPTPLTATGFVATALLEIGSTGNTIPRVQVIWDDPVDQTALGVSVEYQQVGTTNTSVATGSDPTAEFLQLDAQFLPGAEYQARLIFQALAGRTTAPTAWQTFIIPNTVIMPAGVDPISSLLMQALSPSTTVRASVASQIWFPWLDTMDAAFAATASAIADLQSVQGVLTDAGITRNPATGQVTISAVSAVNNDLQGYKTTVSATFDAVNASIALSVTQVAFNQGLAALAVGFDPAYRWDYNTTVDGWTASNATLAVSSSILTYTGTGSSPYLQSPTLALTAAANPLVQVKLTQSVGVTWGMQVQWGSSYQFSQTITEPTTPTSANVVQADMTENANWTGTITGIRIALGDGSTVYLIDYIAIGASPLQAIVVGDLTSSVEILSSNVSLLSGEISTLATAASVTTLSSQLSTAQSDISANTASIALRATQADLNSTNATLTTVQSTLSAQAGQIEQVLAFASGQTAVGQAASPEQMGSNIAAALAGFITQFATLATKLEYARQGLYANVGSEQAARIQAITELQVQFGSNQASLLQIATAVADAISADSTVEVDGTAIFLNLGGFGGSTIAAAFTSEQDARADGDSANASSISNVQAQIGSGFSGSVTISSVISNEASVRAAADSTNANNTSTLASYFGVSIDATNTVTAAINNEASTRASADAANASNLNTLTTTVNGNTTSISTLTSSVNGLNAQWGVQINSNGAVTGLIRLDSGSSHSSFTVVANDFSYYDPTSGPLPLFTIAGGVAFFSAPLVAGLINVGTIIAVNIIDTGHLQVGSATTATKVQGTVNGPVTAAAICSTFCSVVTTNPVNVSILWSGTNTSGATQTFSIQISVVLTSGGTTTFTDSMSVPAGQSLNQVKNCMGVPSAASGTASVSVTGTCPASCSIGATVYLEQVLR